MIFNGLFFYSIHLLSRGLGSNRYKFCSSPAAFFFLYNFWNKICNSKIKIGGFRGHCIS